MSGSDHILGPFAEHVHALAAHYGTPRGDVSPVPEQGQVNFTVFLGDDLVLRLPRKQAYEIRLAKEAAVIPVAQRAGVPTASLVRYDASRAVVDVPYMILERLRGHTLGERGYEPEASGRAHASLGELLATLHKVRMKDVGPLAGVEQRPALLPGPLVDWLIDAGELGRTQGRWLLDWLAFLESHSAPVAEPVLVHGDVSPSNLFVDGEGEVGALIDWGSAHWGDPLRDLVDLPIRALPDLLVGYRTAGRSTGAAGHVRDDDASLEAGALRWHILIALAKLQKGPSTSERRNWSAPKQARFLEILRFLGSGPPSPWPQLVLPA
ncbi:phosphotransferase family protein [Actinopolymorpha rutila]|uniref:Aminoglycoside phosphotransferase (APT) family kinase protein n=1 Tax=Actinopolymorpha rutila TaxID=446787 RepID=A0A852Z8J7_9ACTN|nr:aminoglycoside phosphotransferase family protein [Actinopolymorpha rutila]NYH88693.1 aminoglycoside phosphotransferase (APT) family kinase protein [Actinopolymorpha rutila]